MLWLRIELLLCVWGLNLKILTHLQVLAEELEARPVIKLVGTDVKGNCMKMLCHVCVTLFPLS